MKQFIYKTIVFVGAIILIYEFTIGKQINKYTDKLNAISSKEGRKESVNKLRDEIKKGVKKERYLSKEDAKLVTNLVKSSKLKLQSSIQGDEVRITGKKIDDLQNMIDVLKSADIKLPLQYINFRD